MALEEALGEAFAGFQHGCCSGGAEDAQAALLKFIHDAEG
jgi:hypothetical protein